MIKVAMIGAGSIVFSKNLTGDILAYPEFRDATFSYMDIDTDRLAVAEAMCGKVAKAVGAHPRIEATTDRREALAGADFVINMVQIGGFDSTLIDFEIPRKYGLNFTIADTTGPGGFFRALRTFPMLSGMCRDMMEVCPNAVLLNYSNPMSMNMQTIARTGNVKAVGLCHSVQGTLNQIMGYIDVDPSEVSFICAGINHMAFYLRLEKDGEDLYPRLFEAMKRPDVYKDNKARFELMRMLGYFVTESSEHNAEYCPFFIPHGKEAIAKYSVPIDEYLRRCDGIVEEFERLKVFSKTDAPVEVHRSHEYGSTIIHSIVTGTPSVVYGNMVNNGAIASLPGTAIAEAPTLVDRAGLQFTTVGELPPQLLAYMQPHVSQHELFIRAALEGRRDHVYQAAMFDPLTAATLPLDKIVEMCDELIAAHGDALPNMDAKKTLVPTSGREFGTVDPQLWRRKYDAPRGEPVRDWHVAGPFPSETPGSITLDLPTALEEDFQTRGDGSVDLTSTYSVDKRKIGWIAASAGEGGFVDLTEILGEVEWAVAYAYAEVESVHGREAVLQLGSDDGIKLWLNGKLVHANETSRGYFASSDEAPVYLKPGINRMLVKVDNYVGGWGFGVRVPKANF